MNASHDQAYKLLFSEPELIIDLLRGFVDQEWVKELDFQTLEKVSGSFISDDLRSREDDVIWRVRYRRNWVYIYVLIEFQSTIDPFMAVRLMTYMGLLFQDLIKTKQLTADKKLPPIFPVVLYNGEKRWHAATELKDLISPIPGGLEEYLPSLKYLILDEGAYDVDQLMPLNNLVAAIFRLENAKTTEDILAVVTNLIEWLQAPEQDRVRRYFNLWIKRVLLNSFQDKSQLSEINNLMEMKTMLAKRFPQLIKDSLAESEAKGLIKGEAKILKKQLTLKFGTLSGSIVEKIDAANIQQLDIWLERVLTATKLDEIFL